MGQHPDVLGHLIAPPHSLYSTLAALTIRMVFPFKVFTYSRNRLSLNWLLSQLIRFIIRRIT